MNCQYRKYPWADNKEPCRNDATKELKLVGCPHAVYVCDCHKETESKLGDWILESRIVK